jgi:hypothetical protein
METIEQAVLAFSRARFSCQKVKSEDTSVMPCLLLIKTRTVLANGFSILATSIARFLWA